MPTLDKARRLVVKIGSSLLVDAEKGEIRVDWLDSLAQDVARLRGRNQEVLLVSSGAIAAGRHDLDLPAGKLKLEEKQAAAAAGQIRLAHAYQEALGRYGVRVAQVLLTLGDTEARRQYLNARSTLATLLRIGSVPVINENDTVATAEIRFGDNDRLAARVAAMAWVRQIHRQFRRDARRARAEDDHTLRQEQRLLHIVRHQHGREARALPQRHQLALHGQPRE